MKNKFLTLLAWILLSPVLLLAQQQDTPQQASADNSGPTESFGIKSGFYLKLGPSLPVGNYAREQVLRDTTQFPSLYFPASTGGALDLGFLIYIGKAFANNHLRAGIDATFLSFCFNPIKSDTLSSPKTKYWYYYGGQKFGPVLSIRPIDRLVIDVSYKLNAYVAYLHHNIRGEMNDEWGKNLTQNEISMNIRYSVMLFSFQYNFGQVHYNDYDSYKPSHYVDNNTFRVLVGLKF